VPSDLGKRKTILMQALRWVFHDFISIFIRYFFYVTEYSNEASKLFYFRKDVWYRITQPFITTVIHSNNYHLINPSDVQSLKLGVSNVRIVPKKQGFRLITNFSKSDAGTRTTDIKL
jgi:telomerase reverse transcriptase